MLQCAYNIKCFFLLTESRKRSNKTRKDYFYEGGSASDENSSSDDENDSSLRMEMEESMEEGTPKTAARKKVTGKNSTLTTLRYKSCSEFSGFSIILQVFFLFLKSIKSLI